MRICVVGSGYVGLVTGACLADFGNQVTCVDLDQGKIDVLLRGEIPFYEFGLEDLVQKGMRDKRLSFTTDLRKAIEENEVFFICVGTPRGSDGEANLDYVDAVARDIGRHMNGYKLVVQKSTVPVGTGRRIRSILQEEGGGRHPFDVASNPEFLREGSAVDDFMRPDRVVMGTWSPRAEKALTDIYNPLFINETPFVKTTVESAELIKYAANAFLATKISFVNEMANLCELVGADVKVIEKAMGLDKRIGNKFLHAGAGYGGSCFPKDTEALLHTGREVGYIPLIVEATIEVNRAQRVRLMERMERELGGLQGKTVGVLGLSFKAKTDDVRDSVALDFLRFGLERGAVMKAFDPVAVPNARVEVPGAEYVGDVFAAVKDADAVVIATEWNEFRRLDMEELLGLARGDLLVDLKNIYEPEAMEAIGFRYVGVGRGRPPLGESA
jgi:UDPglucose 6-dehydrogenase